MFFQSLILGGGEVGSSLKKVLDLRKDKEAAGIFDKKDDDFKEKIKNVDCKTLHICFPFGKNFIKDVINYSVIFKPELIIIHSTVPVGTTKKINSLLFRTSNDRDTHAVHSPVRGQHPNLDKGILTFTKYIGTESGKDFEKAMNELSNLKVVWFKKSEDTELGKLLDTSYYGVCIAWHREMERLCKYFGADFENVVTDFNTTYNEGYAELRPNVVRPVLTSPGKKKIGGHCVVQNAKLLKSQRKSNFLDLIK